MEDIKDDTTQEAAQPTDGAAQTEGTPRPQRGGKRQGAGRKALFATNKKTVAVRLPVDLYTYLQMQPNKSTVIEAALRLYCKENGVNLG